MRNGQYQVFQVVAYEALLLTGAWALAYVNLMLMRNENCWEFN